MSFLRHPEIYQVLEPCSSNDLLLERARPSVHALTHRLDESPVGYSWRVALQQSPLPLHQPGATLQQCRGELQESIRWNMDPTLTRCLNLGVHPISLSRSPLAARGERRRDKTGIPEALLCRLHLNNPPTEVGGIQRSGVRP